MTATSPSALSGDGDSAMNDTAGSDLYETDRALLSDEPLRYGVVTLSVSEGQAEVQACLRCGALVGWWTDTHDKWHAGLSAKGHSRTSEGTK